jgi:hypothetical protein
MMHELRVYHCVPGRLPALLKRFETITLGIWARHGIKQAGFWTTLVGPNNQALYYLLAWDSLADREKKWNAFQADQERAPNSSSGPRSTSGWPVGNSWIRLPSTHSRAWLCGLSRRLAPPRWVAGGAGRNGFRRSSYGSPGGGKGRREGERAHPWH